MILFENRMALAHQGHLQILEAIIAQDDKLAKKEAYAHLKWAEKDLAKEINKLDVKKSKTKKSK